MKINLVTESEYFPKGHGVHTAFLNMKQMLEATGQQVTVNAWGQADITHMHTLGPFSFYKLQTSKTTVVSAHVIPDSFVGSLKGTKYWLGGAKKYLRYFYSQADMVVAVAPKVKAELEKLGVKSRIEVFPNPINTRVFKGDPILRKQGREKLGLKETDFVLIAAGQIQKRKGVHDFVEMARVLPEYQFVWVGNQPFKSITAEDDSFEALLAGKPDNMHFPGLVSYDQMPAVYNAADVCFFPSYQENAPMGPIEAAACGLPLLLRDLEEFQLLYGEGYLKAKTEADFRGFIKALASDKELYTKSQKDSLALSQKFSFPVLGGRLVNLYQSLL